MFDEEVNSLSFIDIALFFKKKLCQKAENCSGFCSCFPLIFWEQDPLAKFIPPSPPHT